MNPQPSQSPAVSGGIKRQILVLSVHHSDLRTLHVMLEAARSKIPGLELDDVISAIVAEACAAHRRAQGPPPQPPPPAAGPLLGGTGEPGSRGAGHGA